MPGTIVSSIESKTTDEVVQKLRTGSVDYGHQAMASASESGAVKLHIRSIVENADFRQAYVFGHEFMILQARPNVSGVQSKKACDKDDDYDDADDVENVHGVLRVRHARFQYESTGAPTGNVPVYN
jgi:hypothetical protein